MLKTIGALLTLLILAVGSAVFYFIPKEFHKQVHKVYVPQIYSKLPQTYKQIDKNNHQTVLTGKAFTTTITSVSELNPLENYLLVSIANNKTKKTTEARITYKITEDIELLAEFQNYKTNKDGNSLLISKPVIKLSAPLNRKLLDDAKRVDYLLFNTTASLLIAELNFTWNSLKKPDLVNEAKIKNLALSASASLHDQEMMYITLKALVESADVNIDDLKNQGKNISYSMLFESFNLSGIKSTYQDIIALSEKKDEMPFIFKLMGAMPKIKKIVNYPFVLTNTVTADHEEGPSAVDLEINIEDPEKVGPLKAFRVKYSANSPAKLFEAQAPDSLSGLMTLIYGKQFYPADKKNPLFILSVDSVAREEKAAIEKEIQDKLPLIFENYLKTEVEGKMRYQTILEEAINQKLIVKNENSYLLKGEFADMKFSLNGNSDPMLTFMQLVPQDEVTALMQENGFVSVHATQEQPGPLDLNHNKP